MTVGSQTPDLAVVGGGVIGLTCALAAVDAGMRVVVHDEPTVAEERAPRGGPRRSPDELHGMVEDMIKVLESTVQPELRRGHRPDHKISSRVASVLRAVARELDA